MQMQGSSRLFNPGILFPIFYYGFVTVLLARTTAV
jgi:hypothetical protein